VLCRMDGISRFVVIDFWKLTEKIFEREELDLKEGISIVWPTCPLLPFAPMREVIDRSMILRHRTEAIDNCLLMMLVLHTNASLMRCVQ
jgi:hypothetical protein